MHPQPQTYSHMQQPACSQGIPAGGVASGEPARPDWYIAGAMTGLPDLNFPAFHREAARLRALGYSVVNPAEINPDPTSGWAECMRADIKQLVDCRGVALLPGWEKSRGATFEVDIATRLGMRIALASQITERAE